MTEINSLYRQIDRLTNRLADLDRIGDEPEEGFTFALLVKHPGNETEYSYAFTHTPAGWFSTGVYLKGSMTWAELRDWMLRDDVLILGAWAVSAWESVDDWVDPRLDA